MIKCDFITNETATNAMVSVSALPHTTTTAKHQVKRVTIIMLLRLLLLQYFDRQRTSPRRGMDINNVILITGWSERILDFNRA
jgi:hypothetical protein